MTQTVHDVHAACMMCDLFIYQYFIFSFPLSQIATHGTVLQERKDAHC